MNGCPLWKVPKVQTGSSRGHTGRMTGATGLNPGDSEDGLSSRLVLPPHPPKGGLKNLNVNALASH